MHRDKLLVSAPLHVRAQSSFQRPLSRPSAWNESFRRDSYGAVPAISTTPSEANCPAKSSFSVTKTCSAPASASVSTDSVR